MRKQGETEVLPVIIEDDVWLGARVLLLPGARVGSGSVIGAGAVVSGEIPPMSVAVGNPARVVKRREE
jgi:maltose O-acetyltransferase